MARLTPDLWQSIRNVWEYDPDSPSHEVAAARAGEKFKFKPPSKSNVHAKCAKDKWERRGSFNGINAAAQRKADAMVDSTGNRIKQNEQNEISRGNQNQVPCPILAQAAREDSENKRAEVVARHRTEWRNVAALRQEALNIRVSDPNGAMLKAKFAKVIAEATSIQQTGERKAWGLDILMDPGDLKNMTDEQLLAIINGKVVT